MIVYRGCKSPLQCVKIVRKTRFYSHSLFTYLLLHAQTIFIFENIHKVFFKILFTFMPKLFGSPSKKKKRPDRTIDKGPSQEMNMFVECPICGCSVRQWCSTMLISR